MTAPEFKWPCSILLTLIVGMGDVMAVETGFVEKSLEIDGVAYRYQVFVPEGWNSDQNWPVILFLHGAGERGSDGYEHTEVGIGPVLHRQKNEFPALVVMPQCRRGAWWNDSKMEALVFQSLERTIEEYSGDRDRIYLTGLSMGGYGTFYFASQRPGFFAALAPICGGVRLPREARQALGPGEEEIYLETARKIGDTPIWIFHGAADPVVPVSESQRMTSALQEVSDHVKYTEYPGVGHNSWDRAYADKEFMAWLLAQEK